MPEITVYDYNGQVRDLDYIRARYGPFVIQPPAAGEGPVWHLTEIWEKCDGDYTSLAKRDPAAVKADLAKHEEQSEEAYAAIVVHLQDEDGNPLNRIEVAFYWPDANPDPDAGPIGGVPEGMIPDRAIHGPTNLNGDVGFGIGGGAYYDPGAGQIGPHAVWVYGSGTRSALIWGLGMVAGTNHAHFDVGLTVYLEDPEPPPPPPPPPPPEPALEEILAAINNTFELVEQSLAAVQALQGQVNAMQGQLSAQVAQLQAKVIEYDQHILSNLDILEELGRRPRVLTI